MQNKLKIQSVDTSNANIVRNAYLQRSFRTRVAARLCAVKGMAIVKCLDNLISRGLKMSRKADLTACLNSR